VISSQVVGRPTTYDSIQSSEQRTSGSAAKLKASGAEKATAMYAEALHDISAHVHIGTSHIPCVV